MRGRLGTLDREDEQEIVFKETSPTRKKVVVYNMKTGEPVLIPRYMRDRVLEKPHPDGGYMFTAVQERAPEYIQGDVPCFLAANSPERATGILDEIGLAGIICPAQKLSSVHSKRMHGKHRHSQEWEAVEAFRDEKKEADAIERQNAQLDAMLKVAERGQGAPEPAGEAAVAEPTVLPCTQCNDWETPPDSKNPQASLDMHQRMHCKAREVPQEA